MKGQQTVNFFIILFLFFLSRSSGAVVSFWLLDQHDVHFHSRKVILVYCFFYFYFCLFFVWVSVFSLVILKATFSLSHTCLQLPVLPFTSITFLPFVWKCINMYVCLCEFRCEILWFAIFHFPSSMDDCVQLTWGMPHACRSAYAILEHGMRGSKSYVFRVWDC